MLKAGETQSFSATVLDVNVVIDVDYGDGDNEFVAALASVMKMRARILRNSRSLVGHTKLRGLSPRNPDVAHPHRRSGKIKWHCVRPDTNCSNSVEI